MINFKYNILNSGKDFGNMNGSAMAYSNITEADKKLLARMKLLQDISLLKDIKLTNEEKRMLFYLHSVEMGKHYNFDPHKMFMSDQKKDGYFIINNEFLEANPLGWADILEKILVVEPGVEATIGHPVAGCPVVVAVDLKTNYVACAHCSAELTEQHLPSQLIESLRQLGSNPDDIYVYIGAHEGKNWYYNNYPERFGNDSMWDGYITQNGDKYNINLRPVIMNQLLGQNVPRHQIKGSGIDTITNPNYYSNHSSKELGVKEDLGRHFECVSVHPDYGSSNFLLGVNERDKVRRLVR